MLVLVTSCWLAEPTAGFPALTLARRSASFQEVPGLILKSVPSAADLFVPNFSVSVANIAMNGRLTKKSACSSKIPSTPLTIHDHKGIFPFTNPLSNSRLALRLYIFVIH